jgi:hypothetical protein
MARGRRRGLKYGAELTMFVLYIGSLFEPVIFLNEILPGKKRRAERKGVRWRGSPPLPYPRPRTTHVITHARGPVCQGEGQIRRGPLQF